MEIAAQATPDWSEPLKTRIKTGAEASNSCAAGEAGDAIRIRPLRRRFKPLLALGSAALLAALASQNGQARDRGQYADTNPELKAWFDRLRSGKGPCCSDADGSAVSDVDWESDGGHYRVRLQGQWIEVPDDAVITEPNRVGRTMVWPMYGTLGITIRCFLPGSMT
jgi:hypothetical protein